MDILLGMVGIAFTWGIATTITYVVMLGFLSWYYPHNGKDYYIECDNNRKSHMTVSAIVGAIFVLAIFAKRGGFL